MASLYIEEYSAMGEVGDGDLVPVAGPRIASQKVTYTGTAGQSAAFNANTRFIGITSDGIFSYLRGANPTATVSHFRVPASVILYLSVDPGSKISAITNT